MTYLGNRRPVNIIATISQEVRTGWQHKPALNLQEMGQHNLQDQAPNFLRTHSVFQQGGGKHPQDKTTYYSMNYSHINKQLCPVTDLDWKLRCPKVPRGFNLEQALEHRRGNAIHQLQQDYHTLSTEVANMSNIFEEVFARFRDDIGKEGGRRNNHESQRGNSTLTYSSSSHNDESPKRRRRPPRHPIDYLKDMKFGQKCGGGERVTVERPFHPSWNGERTIRLGKKRQFSEQKIYDSFGFRLKTNKVDQNSKSVLMSGPLPKQTERARINQCPIEQEESSTIGGFGAFEQPRIVEEEQKERAVAEHIERETNRGNEADPPN
ncbi:hypothetical protein Cgig2_026659 [Carnegiea gigantea]|uniref:Uncharacterized protein n=1 Tax=Carnegiea gigantea TaxID=171969 RepID=A0A9Q1JVH4_9CARY|nr:hypothetical protein Cgig2_026659 [Carnegiea gigantea]